MSDKARHLHERDYGQVLVFVALITAALLGILAVVIDLGFIFGQRRFDQNGADAAALAAGRTMAGRVVPRSADGVETYFFVSDEEVYNLALQYAGLDPSQTNPGKPTGVNQNPLMADRNTLAMTLEYWNGNPAESWCFSPQGPEPPRNPAVPQCELPTMVLDESDGEAIPIPPFPDPNYRYYVRVTVSSTTRPFVAGVFFNLMDGDIDEDMAVAPATDWNPACLKPADASGVNTCADAVVAIRGKAELDEASGLLPVTNHACNVAAGTTGGMFQLWGANWDPQGCAPKVEPWENMLDLSNENLWCDGEPGDYDTFEPLMPNTADSTEFANPDCAQIDGDSWNRDIYSTGKDRFVPDTTWDGQLSLPKNDVPYWIANGFRGKVHVPTWEGPIEEHPGPKVPTYGPGDMGANIGAGFYCQGGTVDEDTCDLEYFGEPQHTYFFAKNQPGFQEICEDDYGDLGYGCRDTIVALWANEEYANKDGTGWTTTKVGGSDPQRVQLVKLVNMRLYCKYEGDLCTKPLDNSMSNVWGLFISPFVDDEAPTDEQFPGGPTIYGNVAVLVR